MKKILLSFLICLFANYANAQTVSGVSGTISNGQSITISGSSFGTGPTVVLFDDFEGGSAGQQLQTNLAPIGTYNGVTTPSLTSYSSATKVSGNYAARFVNTGYPADQHPCISLQTSTFSSFYISWWQQYPNNIPGCSIGSCNWKVIWTMGDCCNDADITINSNGASAWLVFGNGDPEIIYPQYLKDPAGTSNDFTSVAGRWNRFQFFELGRENSTGVDQVLYTDVNGTRFLQNQSNVQTLLSGRTNHRYQFFINGYVRDTPNSDTIFDDIYIAVGDYARARVEIGNANTYAGCTSLTMVTPTSWSSGSITGVVRSGNIANGNAWLYVTDSNGNRSSGYAITMGGQGEDVTPPALSTKTIASNGTTLTLSFNETVSIGAGGNGGWTIAPSGGSATLTYSSGSGSSSLVYTISRPIQYNETATVSYTQPTNGVEDDSGNDLVTFSGSSVTNNSTQGQDTTPAAFSFTDTTGATRSTQYTALAQITGINTGITCTGSGGTVAACTGATEGTCGTFGATSGTITNNQYVAARVTSSASYSTAVNNLVTCGGVTDTYSVTTLADPGDITAPTVTSVSVNGSTVTINFSETVVTTGYDTGDFNLDCTSPTLTDVALSSPSGSGASRTFTIATAIVYGQVCNLDYVGSTNDIEDVAGNDMVAFSNTAVTNNTPQSGATPEHSTSDVRGIVLRGVKR